MIYNIWTFALLISSLTGFGGALFMYGYVLVKTPCALHIFIVLFNLLLNIASTIAALLPVVREQQPTSGLMQPAIVSLYTAYLVFSASIWSNPDPKCQQAGIDAANHSKWEIVLPLIIFLFSVMYSIVSSTGKSLNAVFSGNPDEKTRFTDAVSSPNGDANEGDDEAENVQYSYWFLQIDIFEI
ncbi:hypothetical protein ACOME3_007257 [Neoechinorhynchus agilis]